MTAFILLCWRSARTDVAAWLACVWLAVGLGLPAHAENAATEVTAFRLERAPEGLYLTATIKFDLPAAVEDALLKGVPMFFVAQADIYRERWYWTDRKVLTAQRHMRLAYQPLTRRWRLNIASGAINAGSGPK